MVTLVALCAVGAEKILANEIKKLKYSPVENAPGRVVLPPKTLMLCIVQTFAYGQLIGFIFCSVILMLPILILFLKA